MRRRGYTADIERVVNAMREAGLSCPLGDQDLDELELILGTPKSRVDSRPSRLSKILQSSHWRGKVEMARLRLGLLKEVFQRRTLGFSTMLS